LRWTLAASGDLSPGETPRAYGEIVWSWRRDPGVYPACLCGLGNGGKKGRSPGRARISRQTSRGEGRDVSAVPVVFCPCASAHGMPVCSRARDLRAQSAPGLPCASLPGEEQRSFAKPGHIAPRERGRMPDAASHRHTEASPKAKPSRLRLRGGENRAAGIGGFAGGVGAVLTREDVSTNLQCAHRGGAGPTGRNR
jgi:hypothetical protein